MSKQFEAVTIPKWGIEMTHGRIVEWRYSEGDSISAGDELVDIETDKIVNSFEARASGTLVSILIPEGEELAVGTLIGVIALGEHTAEELAGFIAGHQGSSADSTAMDSAPATAESSVSADSSAADTPKISPALLRKLGKAGIDPATVAGTGPGGRIVKEDVDRAIAEGGDSRAAPAASGGQALSASQQRVAASLSKAQMTVPIYHVRRDVAIGPALAQLKAQAPGRSGLLTVLLVQAMAHGLQAHPALNVQFDNDRINPVNAGNVALAVAREDGAVAAPVLTEVGSRSVDEASQALAMLIERARAGRLGSDDMAPAAITLSNLGMFGVDDFTAMVTPPQVMVLSVGRIRKEPVWDETSGAFQPEERLMLTLGSDHRVVNGAQAAQYLQSVAAFIEAAG